MNISDPINEESSAERRLSGGLSALADWPHPVSGVTIEGVVDAGRRGVRRRRRAAALGTAAVVAVAGLGGWGAAEHLSRGTASSAAVGSQGTDPMVPTAAFGWLPGASTGGFGWTVTTGGGSTIDVENGTVNAALNLQYVGEPEPRGPYTPAGTVDGHPAVWVQFNSQTNLAWQYEPGAWAVLLAEGGSNADLLKIADSVQFGGQSPMAMPFHLPAVPAGFTVSGAEADRNSQDEPAAGGGGVTLCAHSGGCSTKNGTIEDRLSLSADTNVQIKQPPHSKTSTVNNLQQGSGDTFGAPATNQPTVRIDGVSAQYSEDESGIDLSVDLHGLSVIVQVNGTAVKAIGGLDGLVKYLDSITWYGGSPSGWTTNVIG